jgi:hypothetical protein
MDTHFVIRHGIDLGWGPFPFYLSALPAALLLTLWLILGAYLALGDDSVDKPSRVAQLYGYSVCLITLLLALVSFSGLVDAAFERANPLQSGDYPFGVSLTSFDAYKAQRGAPRPFPAELGSAPDTASEATLRAQYDGLVADRRASVRYRTSKAYVTRGMLLLIAIALFAFHWRWVRRLNGAGAAG